MGGCCPSSRFLSLPLRDWVGWLPQSSVLTAVHPVCTQQFTFYPVDTFNISKGYSWTSLKMKLPPEYTYSDHFWIQNRGLDSNWRNSIFLTFAYSMSPLPPGGSYSGLTSFMIQANPYNQNDYSLPLDQPYWICDNQNNFQNIFITPVQAFTCPQTDTYDGVTPLCKSLIVSTRSYESGILTVAPSVTSLKTLTRTWVTIYLDIRDSRNYNEFIVTWNLANGSYVWGAGPSQSFWFPSAGDRTISVTVSNTRGRAQTIHFPVYARDTQAALDLVDATTVQTAVTAANAKALYQSCDAPSKRYMYGTQYASDPLTSSISPFQSSSTLNTGSGACLDSNGNPLPAPNAPTESALFSLFNLEDDRGRTVLSNLYSVAPNTYSYNAYNFQPTVLTYTAALPPTSTGFKFTWSGVDPYAIVRVSAGAAYQYTLSSSVSEFTTPVIPIAVGASVRVIIAIYSGSGTRSNVYTINLSRNALNTNPAYYSFQMRTMTNQSTTLVLTSRQPILSDSMGNCESCYHPFNFITSMYTLLSPITTTERGLQLIIADDANSNPWGFTVSGSPTTYTVSFTGVSTPTSSTCTFNQACTVPLPSRYQTSSGCTGGGNGGGNGGPKGGGGTTGYYLTQYTFAIGPNSFTVPIRDISSSTGGAQPRVSSSSTGAAQPRSSSSSSSSTGSRSSSAAVSSSSRPVSSSAAASSSANPATSSVVQPSSAQPSSTAAPVSSSAVPSSAPVSSSAQVSSTAAPPSAVVSSSVQASSTAGASSVQVSSSARSSTAAAPSSTAGPQPSSTASPSSTAGPRSSSTAAPVTSSAAVSSSAPRVSSSAAASSSASAVSSSAVISSSSARSSTAAVLSSSAGGGGGGQSAVSSSASQPSTSQSAAPTAAPSSSAAAPSSSSAPGPGSADSSSTGPTVILPPVTPSEDSAFISATVDPRSSDSGKAIVAAIGLGLIVILGLLIRRFCFRKSTEADHTASKEATFGVALGLSDVENAPVDRARITSGDAADRLTAPPLHVRIGSSAVDLNPIQYDLMKNRASAMYYEAEYAVEPGNDKTRASVA